MNYRLSANDPNSVFKTGDLVTRGGDDLYRVLCYHARSATVEVVCVKPPEGDWCKTGDTEFYAASRYRLAGPELVAKP